MALKEIIFFVHSKEELLILDMLMFHDKPQIACELYIDLHYLQIFLILQQTILADLWLTFCLEDFMLRFLLWCLICCCFVNNFFLCLLPIVL